MRERRKFKRKHLMLYTRVFDADTEQLLGHLVDITPEGALIIGEAPLPPGRTFRLRIELSPDVAEKPFLEVVAASVWCKPDVTQPYYNTGFRLHGLSPEDVQIVNHLVHAYGFQDK